jgi:TIR domain
MNNRSSVSQLFKYDVFISYSHTDSDWVRNTLVQKIEGRGFSVFIDYRDFQGGSFSIEEMQRGVLESKRVILILTPSYIGSEWAHFENVMAQTLDPAALHRKVIPILRENCDIPLRIKIINYRDLRVENIHQFEKLIEDLM